MQLHKPTAHKLQPVHLPNVSLIFLYKFMESVSFMNSRTTSPWSFSTTRTSSGLAMRLTMSNRTWEKLKLHQTATTNTPSCTSVSRALCSGSLNHRQVISTYPDMSANKPLKIEPVDFSPSNEQAEYLNPNLCSIYTTIVTSKCLCHIRGLLRTTVPKTHGFSLQL